MVIPTNQQAYSVAQGTSSIPAFIFQERDPTPQDMGGVTPYPIYTGWVNTLTKAIWYLEAIIPSAGFVTAQWRAVGPIVVSIVDPTSSDYLYPIGQTWINTASMAYWGLVNVTGTVATWENLSSGVAAGILTLTGNTGGSVGADGARNVNVVGASGITITGSPSTHTLTVGLSGGSTAIDSISVDTFTSPGTNPVFPTSGGEIFVSGGQIPAGSTSNVIRTDSLDPSTYSIEIQRSKTEPASTIGSNGVSHFNNVDFSVDNNGFVSLINPGSGAITEVNIQVFTSNGTYTPTPGMKYCIVEVQGGGGGGAGMPTTPPAQGTTVPLAGGSGGGGGYARKVLSASSVGPSQVVTVGLGGTGGLAGDNAGSAGGTTSFGSILSANGGGGGGTWIASPLAQFSNCGLGGTATGGDINITGGSYLTAPYVLTYGNAVYGVPGGSSFYGVGGGIILVDQVTTGVTNGLVGAPGTGYGSGASSSVSSKAGGNPIAGTTGQPGIVIITEYI